MQALGMLVIVFCVLLGVWWLITHIRIEDDNVSKTFGRQEDDTISKIQKDEEA